ncbi:hypothetical protein ERJ75_000564800 [Trypanosoma vivax]|nr:hypothetical protein ERJ75_000564800 [Trypanosoma vivax]
MQSLWFGIAVAAVVVLTRQSRAATPAGLKATDGPKLCEKAFALTRLGEVGLEAARRVEALSQTARANAASIEALIAAASTQGTPGDGWDAKRDELMGEARKAETAAEALTLLANSATKQSMAAARTGADLSGFLLVLAAVGTGANSENGRSCLKGAEQTITGGNVDTNAHYILAQTCAAAFGLLNATNFEQLREAVMRDVEVDQNGESGEGKIGQRRQGTVDECALLGLSQTGTAGSNGLLIAAGGTIDEDKTEETAKKQPNKRITLGSCIEIRADRSGGIKWVDGTVKHGAKNTGDMLEKIGQAVDASDKAKGPCAQHTGACEPVNVAKTLGQLSKARIPKPDPANASMAKSTATSTSAQHKQGTTRTAEQTEGGEDTQRSQTAPAAQVTEAVLRTSIEHAPLGLVALMTVQHAPPH